MTVPVLGYINIASNFLPLGAGLFRWTGLRREYKLFWVFIALGLTSEVVTLMMAFRKMRNLWVLQIYDLLEYILLMIIFLSWQGGAAKRKSIMRWSIAAFIGLWIWTKFTSEPFGAPDALTHTISCIVFIGVTIVTLVGLIREGEHLLRSDPRFWITIALFLYFMSNVIYFFLGEQFVRLPFLDAVTVLYFHWMTTITMNVLSAIGLWKAKQ